MTTVTRSAAESAAKLFGTVAVSADALSTIINAAGNAFDVLHIKSTDWVKETREASLANATVRSVQVRSSAARSMVEHMDEITKFIGTDAKKQSAFDAALAAVNQACDAA